MNIPHHVAIIMDGNGRWAQKRGLPRTAGHKAGGETLKKVLPYLKKRGVKVVTLYAFSSENWARPKDEVDTLIKLFRDYLNNDVNELKKQKTRISFIGNRHKFPDDIIQKMNELELDTENNKDFHVVLALSYGARDDITEAIKQIVGQAVIGMIKGDNITTELVRETLSTHHIPDPDLIIRTSGEQRLSNFLLWEAAYSEFYFPKVHWPDFNETEVDKALEVYTYRNRRFGKV
ncbi:MAG: isoprenyl transferase [Alphaproteobacteria bacterium]|nr:isoprenyl transferase [Alphaproteobacteria bacterium]